MGLGVFLTGFFFNIFGDSYRMAFIAINIILFGTMLFLIPLRKRVVEDLRTLVEKYK